MARATRSTANQEKEKPAETPQPARKPANKKRKRSSAANESDLPAAKVVRTDDDIKEEEMHDGQELQAEETTETELPSSGDVPIRDEDAEKILEVLETCVLALRTLPRTKNLFSAVLTRKGCSTEYSHCQPSMAQTQMRAPQQARSLTPSEPCSSRQASSLPKFYA